MKLLAIETAVSPGSIALAKATSSAKTTDAGELFVRPAELPADQRTAQSLAPALAASLRGMGWKASDLDRLAVSVGPGSFTGLRIGVTTAKTLAYAAQAPCVPVNTLAVLAAQAPEGSTGWAVLDAQRRELFAAPFTEGKLAGEVAIYSETDWLAMLQPGDVAIGPVLKRLVDGLPEGVTAADPSRWAPHAATVAKLAAAAGDDACVSPFDLLPDYGRLSAAEEKLQQK